MGEGSPQAPSSDPQQEPFYPNRALVDVYGSSLASSKSEPHGQPFVLILLPFYSGLTPVSLMGSTVQLSPTSHP